MVKGVHIPWNHWWAHFNNDKKMQLSGLTAKSPLPITTKKLSIFLNHVFCSRLAADSDKTPSDDTLFWENLQVVFVMLVVVVFVTGGFYVSELLFLSTGTPPWLPRPVKASTSSELYPGYLWLLTFARYATVLRSNFLPTGIFNLTLLHHIFDTFCDSDADRDTPSRIILCACPHRVVDPFGWRMDLNYSYCSWKNLDLWIVPVSHKG